MDLLQARAGGVRHPVGWAVATGVAYALAQPTWGFWALAGVCLVPLLRGCVGRSAGVRAGLGWLAGTLASLLSGTVPVATAATAYWEVPAWQGIAIALMLGQVFGAGSFALAAVLAGDPSRAGGVGAALRIAAAWAGAEYVRSVALTGLPWLLLAHSLASQPALIQLAEFGGELAVSFLLAGLNAALLLVGLRGQRRAGLVVGLASLSLFLAAATRMPRDGDPGSVREIGSSPAAWSDSVRVLLVQGNLSNRSRRDPARVAPALESLVELSRSDGRLDLTVWPENALNVALPMNQPLLTAATEALSSRYLLLGTPRIETSTRPRLYNSAVLFGPPGRLRAHRDKHRLLPFAEYWPWPLQALKLPGVMTTPGPRPQALLAGELRLGSLICYEILFAEIAHALVRDGAEILVNLSNEAWFGATGAIEQHFAAAIFRAVETRRPLLRSTNTGITAAIDAAGRVAARLPTERAAALAVEVRPGRAKTWAVGLGGSVGIFGLAVAGWMTLRAWVVERRPARAAKRRRRG